jgi:DNA-binding XRE family transcriptional regulator
MEENLIKAIDTICVNLVVLRNMLGLTQQDLAIHIGTSRQSIINFERQEKKITRSLLISIITYFSLRRRSASYLKSLGFYKNKYIESLGFNEDLCNYIIEHESEEKQQ